MNAHSRIERQRQVEYFQSGGRRIRMETFFPEREAEAPSILVLHGATGVEFANRFIAVLGQQFAEEGFAVHLVHYFDRTGTTYADDEAIRRSAHHWLSTVHDAIQDVRARRPDVPLGVFGYSLGGYLAAAASLSSPEVSAAVILAGGLDENSAGGKLAPPTLILHGSEDVRVPPREARRLEAALVRNGRAPEVKWYPGEGHLMGLRAYADVVARGATFFRRHLVPLHSDLKAA